MLIDSDDIDIYKINRIDIVVSDNHGQGAFRYPMKILYIMNNSKRHESIQSVGCVLCKKYNGIILKNVIIKHIGDSINLLNKAIIFYDQHISPSNIYLTGDLEFLVILLGNEYSSPHWCITCKSPSKYWKSSDHSMDTE